MQVVLEPPGVPFANQASEARGPPYRGLCGAAWAEGIAGTWGSDAALPSARARPLRDQGPPEGQTTLTEETQRDKRPRPLQVLTGMRRRQEGGGPWTRLVSDLLWVRGSGNIIFSHARGGWDGLEGASRCCGSFFQKEGKGQ